MTARQPVHTVYGGAHLFRANTAERLGAAARRSLETHAPSPDVLARALDLRDAALAATVYERVVEKLQREPVEDFRIDFEDGFGVRPDDEEDQAALQAARETASAAGAGLLPPFCGIRIRSMAAESRRRALRTLELFVTELVRATRGTVPPNFVVTLPKITGAGHVTQLADALDAHERSLGLQPGALKLELMIETPQSIFGADGRVAPPALVEAARARCAAAHFGTYDYTASLSITAAHQQMTHAACDFARHVLQVSLAGSGVWLSDGATNVLPVGPDTAAVHRAWKLHYDHVRHSLAHAYYQGWDLHPAQLPTRFAAVYAFFLEGFDAAAERLRGFVDRAAQASLVGGVFDDAATGQGLLNFFLRGINCGAVTEREVAEQTGLGVDELRTRSFAEILKRRG